jgi:hypothetical protein
MLLMLLMLRMLLMLLLLLLLLHVFVSVRTIKRHHHHHQLSGALRSAVTEPSPSLIESSLHKMNLPCRILPAAVSLCCSTSPCRSCADTGVGGNLAAAAAAVASDSSCNYSSQLLKLLNSCSNIPDLGVESDLCADSRSSWSLLLNLFELLTCSTESMELTEAIMLSLPPAL